MTINTGPIYFSPYSSHTLPKRDLSMHHHVFFFFFSPCECDKVHKAGELSVIYFKEMVQKLALSGTGINADISPKGPSRKNSSAHVHMTDSVLTLQQCPTFTLNNRQHKINKISALFPCHYKLSLFFSHRKENQRVLRQQNI